MFAGRFIIMAIDVGGPYFIAIFMVECAQYSLEGNKVLMSLRNLESRPVSVLFGASFSISTRFKFLFIVYCLYLIIYVMFFCELINLLFNHLHDHVGIWMSFACLIIESEV